MIPRMPRETGVRRRSPGGYADPVIDPRLLRDDPDRLRAAQRKRGLSPDVVDDALAAVERGERLDPLTVNAQARDQTALPTPP